MSFESHVVPMSCFLFPEYKPASLLSPEDERGGGETEQKVNQMTPSIDHCPGPSVPLVSLSLLPSASRGPVYKRRRRRRRRAKQRVRRREGEEWVLWEWVGGWLVEWVGLLSFEGCLESAYPSLFLLLRVLLQKVLGGLCFGEEEEFGEGERVGSFPGLEGGWAVLVGVGG